MTRPFVLAVPPAQWATAPLAPEVVYPHTARVVSEDDRCDTCGQRAVIGMCASCEAEQAAINSGGWW